MSHPRRFGRPFKHILGSNNSTFRFKCDRCGKSFETIELLLYHFHSVHRLWYGCSYCWSHFNSPIRQCNHQKASHEDGKCYPCRFCQLIFRSTTECENHTRAVHPFCQEFICDICDYVTYSAYSLALHRDSRKHFLGRVQPLVHFCHICSKVFPDRSQHFLHMCEQHQARWVCKYCDYHPSKLYEDIRDMMAHVRSEHSRKDIWYCAICSRAFMSEREVKDHWTTHGSTLYCLPCDMVLPSQQCLKRHNSDRHSKKAAPNAPVSLMEIRPTIGGTLGPIAAPILRTSGVAQTKSNRKIVFNSDEEDEDERNKSSESHVDVQSIPLPPGSPRKFRCPQENQVAAEVQQSEKITSNAQFISSSTPPQRLLKPKQEPLDEPDVTTVEDEPHSSGVGPFRVSDVSQESSSDDEERQSLQVVKVKKKKSSPKRLSQNRNPLLPSSRSGKRPCETGSETNSSSKRIALESKPIVRTIRPTVGSSKKPIAEDQTSSDDESEKGVAHSENYTQIPLLTPSALKAVVASSQEDSNSSEDSGDSSSSEEEEDEGVNSQSESNHIHIVSGNSSQSAKKSCATVTSAMPTEPMTKTIYNCKLCGRINTWYPHNVIKHLKSIHNTIRPTSIEYGEFIESKLVTVVSRIEPIVGTPVIVASTSDVNKKKSSGSASNCSKCTSKKQAAVKLLDELNAAIKELQSMAEKVEMLC